MKFLFRNSRFGSSARGIFYVFLGIDGCFVFFGMGGLRGSGRYGEENWSVTVDNAELESFTSVAFN